MNKVGEEGKGESVWLAFFLHDVLIQFSELSLLRKDQAFSDRCLHEAAELRKNIEAGAGTEGGYRRAYFDDGSPLGSAVIPNAVSIPSPKVGPCFRTRGIPNDRGWPWRR